ncbi:hypothetical protein GCM10009560_32700 [Nonomuraea longicatena]|uniref:Uncharacterized protein n=2 Tax=Nonomuraea longicatena TaxID=83682 RepID=A0ABN1PKH1_9ACTN
MRVHAVTSGPVAHLAEQGAIVTAEVTLTDDPKIRPPKSTRFPQDRVAVEARIDILQTDKARIAVRSPVVLLASGRSWRNLLPSQRLQVSGKLVPGDQGTLTAALFLLRGQPEILSGPSSPQTVAGEIRAGLRNAANVLPTEQRGLLPGLVVGDVSRMDPQVSADFKDAGLSHLTAVSGANLAIVAGAVLALSRLTGLPLAARAGLAAVAMIAFAVVARPSPSVLRALLMGLVAAVALGTGRARDGVAALSASVLLLILFNPELARSYAFALSVTATAGILLLAPTWRDRLTGTSTTTSEAPLTHDEPPAGTADSHNRQTTPAKHRPPVLRTSGQSSRPRRPLSDHVSSARSCPPSGHPSSARPCLPSDHLSSAVSSQPADHIPSPMSRPLAGSEPPAVHRQPMDSVIVQYRGELSSHRDALLGDPGRTGLGVRTACRAAGRWVRRRFAPGHGRARRMPRWVAEAITIPAAAQAAVTPVLVLMAGELTPVAVLANLLAGPAVAPATLLGFAAALIAPISQDAAELLVIPAGYAVGWIITIAQWSARLPLATIPWPGGLPGVAMLAIAAVAAVLLLRRARWRAVLATLTVATLIVVYAVGPAVAPWPPKGWLFVMCDVGQGDGMAVAAGEGRAVVVDTGPDPVAMDRCLSDLGIQEVPLVILTHPHMDHTGGLAGILRDRRVGAIVVASHHTTEAVLPPLTPAPAVLPSHDTDAGEGTVPASGGSVIPPVTLLRDPEDAPGTGVGPEVARRRVPDSGDAPGTGVGSEVAWRRVPDSGDAPGTGFGSEVTRRRIPVWAALPGTRWQFGPSELTVLAPDQDAVGGHTEGSEVNNGSLVVRVRWQAGSLLLSGDIETEAQAKLLRAESPAADILKVPHHGSARQDADFIDAVGARAALISVGADNDYGHPAPSTLSMLQRAGARVYRTDRSGDLAVVSTSAGLAVTTRH